MASSTGRIRALNDDLRSSGRGGTTVITAGIAALCDDSQATIMAAVQSFTDFTPDNDPYGEHDCAVLEAAGQRVLFKIDYYDRQLCGHSVDAADPAVTHRVLLSRPSLS